MFPARAKGTLWRQLTDQVATVVIQHGSYRSKSRRADARSCLFVQGLRSRPSCRAALLLFRPKFIGKPHGGASQMVIAGFDQLRSGLRIFGGRRQNETLFRQMAMVLSIEGFHAVATRLGACAIVARRQPTGRSGVLSIHSYRHVAMQPEN
jgi:hypothetical protein